MPIYEYRCTSCGREFEEFVRSAAEAAALACPACAARAVQRLMSRPAAVGGGGAPARRVPGCGPVG